MDNGTHWRDILNQQGRTGRQVGDDPPSAGPGNPAKPDGQPRDDELELDMSEYRPWILQRGRSRPAALIDLRWYDARAGMWLGCAMAYPQLLSVEYVGERMVSLDFGKRQFVLEGEGLIELVRRIQDGSVVAIQEYAPALWPKWPSGPCITSIKRVNPAREASPGQTR